MNCGKKGQKFRALPSMQLKINGVMHGKLGLFFTVQAKISNHTFKNEIWELRKQIYRNIELIKPTLWGQWRSWYKLYPVVPIYLVLEDLHCYSQVGSFLCLQILVLIMQSLFFLPWKAKSFLGWEVISLLNECLRNEKKSIFFKVQDHVPLRRSKGKIQGCSKLIFFHFVFIRLKFILMNGCCIELERLNY